VPFPFPSRSHLILQKSEVVVVSLSGNFAYPLLAVFDTPLCPFRSLVRLLFMVAPSNALLPSFFISLLNHLFGLLFCTRMVPPYTFLLLFPFFCVGQSEYLPPFPPSHPPLRFFFVFKCEHPKQDLALNGRYSPPLWW